MIITSSRLPHVLEVHKGVVDRNHRRVGVRVHGAEHHAPDAPEPVDSHADRHPGAVRRRESIKKLQKEEMQRDVCAGAVRRWRANNLQVDGGRIDREPNESAFQLIFCR